MEPAAQNELPDAKYQALNKMPFAVRRYFLLNDISSFHIYRQRKKQGMSFVAATPKDEPAVGFKVYTS